MYKTLLEQAKELLKNIESNPETLKAFQELVKARAEESKHVEMEMSPEKDKKKRIDELSKRIKACMEKMQKESMDKDDKPHLPGTPEDKAHDVVEEGENVKHALKGLKDKSPKSKEKMLSHLRTLKDKSQLRSTKNKEAGKESHKKKELNKSETLEKTKKIRTASGRVVYRDVVHQGDEVLIQNIKQRVQNRARKKSKKTKVEKSEQYYRNLVKSELAKAKIIDFKTKQTLADLGEPEGVKKQRIQNIVSNYGGNNAPIEHLMTNEYFANAIKDPNNADFFADFDHPGIQHELIHNAGYIDPDKLNEGLNNSTIEKLINSKYPDVRVNISDTHFYKLTPKQKEKLVYDPDPDVRFNMSHFSHELPGSLASKLLNDPDEHVKRNALWVISRHETSQKSETYYRNLVKSTLEKQLMTPPFGMSEIEKEEDPRKMVESSLMAIHRKANYLQKLLHEVCECEEVPAWIQDKLSSAKTHMTDVMDYIASQVGKGAHHEESEMQPEQAAEIIVQKNELGKEQAEPTRAPKSKAII